MTLSSRLKARLKFTGQFAVVVAAGWVTVLLVPLDAMFYVSVLALLFIAGFLLARGGL